MVARSAAAELILFTSPDGIRPEQWAILCDWLSKIAWSGKAEAVAFLVEAEHIARTLNKAEAAKFRVVLEVATVAAGDNWRPLGKNKGRR
jgi:hypothetical protein